MKEFSAAGRKEGRIPVDGRRREEDGGDRESAENVPPRDEIGYYRGMRRVRREFREKVRGWECIPKQARLSNRGRKQG